MNEIKIKKVEGGYSIEAVTELEEKEIKENELNKEFKLQESVHATIEDAFAKQLELFEKRTEKGKGTEYGKITILRTADIPTDVLKKKATAEATVEAAVLPEEVKTVKHEDVIQFEKGAVEKIKEAEKEQLK